MLSCPVKDSKRIVFVTLIGLIFSLIGVACSPRLMATASIAPTMRASATVTTEPPTPSKLPISVPTPTETATPGSTRTQYKLTAELDYAVRQLVVNESIRYTNRSTDSLEALELMVEGNQNPGEFQLTAATWPDGTSIQGITLVGEKLTLPVPGELNPGQSLELTLAYRLDLPATKGVLSFGSRQVNMAGWYPYVVPYLSGQGWLINVSGAVGEYQVYEPADFDVSFRVINAPAALIVAASAGNDSVIGGYHYLQNNVRNFTLTASTNYTQYSALAGDTLVTAYVFSGDEIAGQASLDTTTQALAIYGNLFGSYTRKTLTVVEADFPDGMEEDGLYFLGSEYFKAYTGEPASYLVALSAHETAHQWWFAMVGNDQAHAPWLDEALATYSESLFYEQEYPDLVDWWWQTRVQVYSPQGKVDSTIYDFNAFRPYVNAVYLRGATFLEELRKTIGDEAFFAFLRGYFGTIQKSDLALTDASQFWYILSQYTTADLSGLKSRYFTP
jgi:Peptidase family M1 domain